MRIIRSVAAMQRLAKSWRAERLPIALVPTMGSLHAGHLSLCQRARRLARKTGRVVVSIYVNPAQFGPKEDFSRYPRDLGRDARLCRAEGVDVIFAPSDRQMYPATAGRPYSTYVVEERLSSTMEGASRPTHFRGVTTVVAKLFNLVQPNFAVFGAKDYQQSAIVRQMVRDLNFPLKIVVVPTFREADGLAMSSRNKYLEGSLRTQARVLWGTLEKLRSQVRNSKRSLAAGMLKSEVKSWVERESAARLDYVEFFDSETLAPAAQVRQGTHMAVAVFIGKTRLIDNRRL
jgi:pantoate--beta-alanine ligase